MDELATSGSAGQHGIMKRLPNVNNKSMAKRRKRYLRRVVEKSGEPNIQYKNISKRRRKYFSDLYTTLVDSRYVRLLLRGREQSGTGRLIPNGINFSPLLSTVRNMLFFSNLVLHNQKK